MPTWPESLAAALNSLTPSNPPAVLTQSIKVRRRRRKGIWKLTILCCCFNSCVYESTKRGECRSGSRGTSTEGGSCSAPAIALSPAWLTASEATLHTQHTAHAAHSTLLTLLTQHTLCSPSDADILAQCQYMHISIKYVHRWVLCTDKRQDKQKLTLQSQLSEDQD